MSLPQKGPDHSDPRTPPFLNPLSLALVGSTEDCFLPAGGESATKGTWSTAISKNSSRHRAETIYQFGIVFLNTFFSSAD